jgi:hypothetical protein
LNEKRRLKMPVAEVARKKRNSICCSATAKGGARSAGAYRCTAWPDSVCGGLGKYA